MKYILILLSLFYNICSKSVSNASHDFHISRCEINYETRSGDLQITAHIFIDDLEEALTLQGKSKLYLGTDKESPIGNEAVEQYLNQNLIIKSGGKKLNLSLLGKETSKDKMAIWCYFEVVGLKDINSIDLENKILIEIFNDQKNIVDFTVDKKKKHFTIFDNKKNKENYTW